MRDLAELFVREMPLLEELDAKQLGGVWQRAEQIIDSEMLDNFELQDFDLPSLRQYQALLEARSGRSYGALDDESFLKSVGLIKEDRSSSQRQWKYTKAALLLFGKYDSIRYVFPSFFIDFISDPDHSDQGRIYTSSESGCPDNLFSFYMQVKQWLNCHVLNSANRADQALVLHEALVNFLVHADYSSYLSSKITRKGSVFDFCNPGSMQISVSDFIKGGKSLPRNPLIFSACMRARLGERSGNGGQRIYQTLAKLKAPQPKLLTDKDSTELIIDLQSENN
ncbi:ATP-binding protein [Lactobacillus equicursoris]|uniref:ATP-binding protein n=1 Tax=Lactobacillus equicursoris TaxID=420645 RepID=UPI003995906E